MNTMSAMIMLRAIDRSALSSDRAAPSRDLLSAQKSIDGATIDGSHCATGHCFQVALSMDRTDLFTAV